MASTQDNQPSWQPVNAVGEGLKSTALFGAAGLFMSAIQNSMAESNVRAMGVFTRTGGIIGLSAAGGGATMFTIAATANLREKKDPWCYALGGFVGGAIFGLRGRSIATVLGSGAGLGTLLAVGNYTGWIFGNQPGDFDRFEDKETIRKTPRRPIEETIAEIGEGRGGIFPAGYRERRQQRIKEKYGIDVPV